MFCSDPNNLNQIPGVGFDGTASQIGKIAKFLGASQHRKLSLTDRLLADRWDYAVGIFKDDFSFLFAKILYYLSGTAK